MSRNLLENYVAEGEEAVKSQIKLQILEEYREELSERLEPERFYCYLRSKFHLTRHECQDIENKHTNTKAKACYFLDILLDKGPQSFDYLCKALEKERYSYILNLLNGQYEKRLNRYRESSQPEGRLATQLTISNHDLPPPILPGQRHRIAQQNSFNEDVPNVTVSLNEESECGACDNM